MLTIRRPLSHPGLHTLVRAEQPGWALLLNLGVLLIGLAAMAGNLWHWPKLYYWNMDGVALTLQMAASMVALSMGFFCQHGFRLRQRWLANLLALGCYTLALAVGLVELKTLWGHDLQLNTEAFLVAGAPVMGNTALYGNLGLLLAPAISIAHVFVGRQPRWGVWLVQLPGLFLLNLAAFGFLENVADIALLRDLMSLPASVALFLYGAALVFYPYRTSWARRPFFASAGIRWMAWGLLAAWALATLWQAMGTSQMTGSLAWHGNLLRRMVINDDLLEMTLSTVLLAQALYLPGLVDEILRLRQRLHRTVSSSTLLMGELLKGIQAPLEAQHAGLERLLGWERLDEAVLSQLEALKESAGFALQSSGNCLAYLQYETHQEPFNPTLLELNMLLARLRHQLDALAARRGHLIRVLHVDEAEQIVMADGRALSQALYNLVDCVSNHLRRGHVIELSAHSLDKAFQFVIHTEGPVHFSQGDLAFRVAERMIARHGGDLQVERHPNRGISYRFTLPKYPASHTLQPLPLEVEGGMPGQRAGA